MSDEQPKAPARSIPVTWKSGDGSRVAPIHSRASVVTDVSPSEAALFGNQNVTTCGSCKFFMPRSKDPRGIKKLVELAVYEAKWQMGWIAPDPRELGRCGQNSETAVGPHSRSCDQYRASNGKIR